MPGFPGNTTLPVTEGGVNVAGRIVPGIQKPAHDVKTKAKNKPLKAKKFGSSDKSLKPRRSGTAEKPLKPKKSSIE